MQTNNTTSLPFRTLSPAALAVMPPTYTPGQLAFVQWLHAHRDQIAVYDECTVSRAELIALIHRDSTYVAVPAWIAVPHVRRQGRGNYLLPEIMLPITAFTVNTNRRGRTAGARNRKGRPPITTGTL